jgi:hypothetical protein
VHQSIQSILDLLFNNVKLLVQLLSHRAIIRGTMDDGNTSYPALRANGNSAGALDRALADFPLLVARALEIATPVELVDLRNRADFCASTPGNHGSV